MIFGNSICKFGKLANKVWRHNASAAMALFGNNNLSLALNFF